MLGSDKHHICLKGTNINDPYSSYHKRACNDRGILSRKNKSFRYCEFTWQIKTDNIGFEKKENKKDQPTGLIPILRQ